MNTRRFDLVCFGRAGVDLYAEQIGAPLEDAHSFAKYLGEISWETEVWVAESPTHLIHFNGERFLGPYE